MRGEWAPECSLEKLKVRADLLSDIRSFFLNKGVMEVETPLLCQGTGTDPDLSFFSVQYSGPPRQQTLYLQTSPEFAMKRLLAAGSGSIFQICKAFRNGESGRYHNPEFTILEWYRIGYDLDRLMDEVEELMSEILVPCLNSDAIRRIPYRDIFFDLTGVDPLIFSLSKYASCARENNLPEAEGICGNDHGLWLDFLFSFLVQPGLSQQGLHLIYDYPACKSSLARIKTGNAQLAERMELFADGLELGNGFYELCDSEEQSQRFSSEIRQRNIKGMPAVVKDQRFLAALDSGLPDCSGMAIGLDRLLMLMSGSAEIEEILAFPVARA